MPDPIQVQTSVNTILPTDSERPATIMSSWLLTWRDFQKFITVRPIR